MRLSIHGNLRRQTRSLWVGLQGDERLDFSLLRTLRAGDADLLAPLAEERESRTGRHTICYDLSGMWSLRKCLRHESRREVALCPALCDLVGVLEWGARNARGASLLLFDPQYVYVGEDGHLRFVCLPIKGLAREDEQSPLVLLEALTALRRSKHRSPNERETARRLVEYLGAEGQAFSLNRLRAFVREECGGMAVSQGAQPAIAQANAPAGACVLQNVRTGETYELPSSRALEVGRGLSCDIQLCDCPKVSRRHASVRRGARGVLLTDLGSTNGTYVEGRRVSPHREVEVAYGQTFYLSDQEFAVGRDRT